MHAWVTLVLHVMRITLPYGNCGPVQSARCDRVTGGLGSISLVSRIPLKYPLSFLQQSDLDIPPLLCGFAP
jgi:hypothetical protein